MENTIDDRYSSFALLSNVATFLGFACFDIFYGKLLQPVT